jgi:hypothetical protein
VGYPEALGKEPKWTADLPIEIHPAVLTERAPIEEDVISDLLQMKNTGVDLGQSRLENDVHGVEVIQSLRRIREGKWKDGEPIYGSLNINSRQVRSLKIGCPEKYSGCLHTNVLLYEEDGDLGWETAAIPMSSVTPCHLDQWGMSIFMFHISGRKLWMFWPPIPKNLEIYAKHVTSTGTLLSIEVAVAALDGLQLLYIADDSQPSWCMPPGTLHAVITFSPLATHGGFYLAQACDFKKVKKNVRTYLDVVVGCKEELQTAGGKSEMDKYLWEMHHSDLPLWKDLGAKLKTKDLELGTEVDEWVEDSLQEIQELAENSEGWERLQGTAPPSKVCSSDAAQLSSNDLTEGKVEEKEQEGEGW